MQQQTLSDRYQLERRIGSGGMADVWLARDQALNRPVAVKILHASYAADPLAVERFRREAQAAAGLSHPNVVTVYDWGQMPSSESPSAVAYYLVMEYVPGPNLKEVIAARGPLPEGEALDAAAQIASALEAAHARGLIHRDVKSQNVLLDPSGRVKVADFGIAYLEGLTHLTRTNVVSGTAHYISPEQAQGRRVDARTDLYSLGVVMYEMLTGRVPFEGDSLVDVAVRHVQEPPVPPSRLRPGISPQTEEIVMRALAKDPVERFAGAAEMRAAIERARAALRRQAETTEQRVAPGLVVEQVRQAPQPGTAPALPPPADRTVKLGTGVVGPRPRVRKEQRRLSPWLMAVPVLLILLAGGALLWHARSSSGTSALSGTGKDATPAPTATARPAAASRHHASPPNPTSAPAASPPATNTPISHAGASQQGSRPVPTAAPRAANPTVPPAPAVVPPHAVVQPTATVPAGSGGGSPADAVSGFYSAIAQRQWANAASYWTGAMQGRCPPQSCIDGRFANTSSLNLTITGVTQQGNRATVGIDLLEGAADGATNHWVGSWHLVKGGSGWLLDSVSLSQAGASGALPPAPGNGAGKDKPKAKGNEGDGNGNG